MKIHFVIKKPAAQDAISGLIDRYEQTDIAHADYIVAVGGDGTALHALELARSKAHIPVFAMRLPDSVGALGNIFDVEHLDSRLKAAQSLSIRPLRADATLLNGDVATCFGINEIVVSRQNLQTAKLQVTRNEAQDSQLLVGDGLLVATPIGSTGYNSAAGGPRLPMDARMLVLVSLAARQPWGPCRTVIDERTVVEVRVIDPAYRPVKIETNTRQINRVRSVRITCDSNHPLTLLKERHC